MSCPREARKRCKTIAFWVTPAQAAEIDEMTLFEFVSRMYKPLNWGNAFV